MAAQMLLTGQTDQVTDHRARNRCRVLLDDVERFASAAVLQQTAGEGTNVCLERADATRTKPRR